MKIMFLRLPIFITVAFTIFWACNADIVLRIQYGDDKIYKSLQDTLQHYQTTVWKHLKKSFDLQVPVSLKSQLIAKFNASVILEDAEKALEENVKQNELAKKKIPGQEIVFSVIDYFALYDEIIKWMQFLQQKTPLFVSLKTIGKSFQGRPMRLVKIGFPGVAKKAVFITGGFHAREWLAVSTAVFAIHKLISGIKSGDEAVWKVLSKYDFYILPVANPDGYDYTFSGGKTRMWRKTRKPYGKCVGVDPNRNFDIDFGVSGASVDPCSIVYHGPTAFSENSTANIKKFAESIKDKLLMYIDIHSYSQMILLPYGYNHTETPKNNAEIRRVAQLMQTAIKAVNNRTYVFGTPGELLDIDCSGTCMDWMVKVLGVKYGFGFEVWPPVRPGHNGFTEVSPKDIGKTGKEIFAGILAAAKAILL